MPIATLFNHGATFTDFRSNGGYGQRMKSEDSVPNELYKDAVSDGTHASKPESEAAEAVVVESNASNYGAGAVATPTPPGKGK